MSINASGATSIRKQDLVITKQGLVAVKKIVFAHKATLNDTGIDLSSLSVPASFSSQGFANPSSAELQAARLFFFRKNLRLWSDNKGQLEDYRDYTVDSNLQINFTATFGLAATDEIFVGHLDPASKTGTLVADSDSLVATGTLTGGTTTINLGKAKPIVDLTQQVGAVMVFIDGQQIFRNVGNAAAAPAADGNYEEVDTGNGEFTVIELNDSDPSDRPYLVVSTAIDVLRPDNSIKDVIEQQQGTIDKIVEDLAVTTGNPETNYQAGPSQPVLKNFGDRVIKLETYIPVVSADSLAKRTAVGPVDRVLFDTTAGVGTYVLTPTPAIGSWVEIWDTLGTWGSNTMTVDRNGSLIEGAAADFTISTDNVRVKFVYTGASQGWIVGDMS